MDIIRKYNSICASCKCHPSWHTEDGVCHFDNCYMKVNVVKFGRCEGCTNYVPSDNLEYVEFKYERSLSYI